MSRIPFNKPFIAGKELHYIEQAMAFGRLAGDGVFTRRCEKLLENCFDIHKVLMTPSCTAALEMAAMLCNLGPDDEVILPSYTFISTVNALVLCGATPVFVDIRPDTLNIDDSLIEQAITPQTKAIFPVHYAGVACEMDHIMSLAEKHGLMVVEDAAQGVHGYYNGRPLGSIGHFGTYSFHETKNYMCGEGGALCINTPELLERAEIIRDKGTNRKQFFCGLVDKYSWVDIGSSYTISEVCSAFLFAQLEQMEEIAQRRQAIYEFYQAQLEPLEAEGLLRLPQVPDACQSSYHMFYVLLHDRQTRDQLIEHLLEHHIQAVFHYVPLHSTPMGQKFGYRKGDLPVTEDLSGRLLRLPFFCEIEEEEQVSVVRHIRDYLTSSPPQAPVSDPLTINPAKPRH
jgi:dTDP-4-amino-4,6-dideoxygalactose transaminase